VPGDTNGVSDVFVHDCRTGETTRASVSSTRAQANGGSGFAAISADGRYVAFQSLASNLVRGDTNDSSDVFLHDRTTGRTERVSIGGGGQGNAGSEGPAISNHGRYVGFSSGASNLVPGDTNGLPDVFVRDRSTGRTVRISVSSNGREGRGDPFSNGSNAPSISAHGRYVAFHSDMTTLVAGDTNGTEDIFVHDLVTGLTARASVSSDGVEANGESLGPPSVSPGGRYVAFASLASNLVPGDLNGITDVFVHDVRTGRTFLASLGQSGEQGNDGSVPGPGRAWSAGARFLAFSSWASNLVPGDTNSNPDAFVRELR
jgi:Tol biopolymer transport system component